jgi:hypothetical protein
VQLINNYSDVVMLNYYPQNHQFQVLDTSIVHAHFADIVTAFPTKDIWMTELGYQSGSNLCASSELKQAHFYHNMFQAWDTQKEHIKLVLINWLFDQSPQLIEEWKEYYGNDPALVEYLRHWDCLIMMEPINRPGCRCWKRQRLEGGSKKSVSVRMSVEPSLMLRLLKDSESTKLKKLRFEITTEVRPQILVSNV